VKLKNPAAVALMAKMNIRPADRVRVKLQILRLLATLRLNSGKMDLIAGFMENYPALSRKEELARKLVTNLTTGIRTQAIHSRLYISLVNRRRSWNLMRPFPNPAKLLLRFCFYPALPASSPTAADWPNSGKSRN